jgi:hypothetical protein
MGIFNCFHDDFPKMGNHLISRKLPEMLSRSNSGDFWREDVFSGLRKPSQKQLNILVT